MKTLGTPSIEYLQVHINLTQTEMQKNGCVFPS